MGDPHGKVSGLAVFRRFLEGLIQIQRDDQGDPWTTIILGDLFDTHAVIRSEVLNSWLWYFEQVAALPRRPYHILIKGNHDEVGPGSEYHSLSPFARIPDTCVVDGPDRIPVDGTSNAALFVPYVAKEEEFARIVAQADGSEVLFCHQSFNGCQFENGQYDPHGFSTELVSRFPAVISGHIHREQSFANIWYPGTPYQQDFGDSGHEKHVWWYRIDGRSRVPVSLELPNYVQFTVDGCRFIEPMMARANPADHYRLKVTDDVASIDAFRAGEVYRRLRKEFDVRFVFDVRDAVAIKAHISETLPVESMLDQYCRVHMDTSTLDRAMVADRALGYMKRVSA